jgi:hypothetical protein
MATSGLNPAPASQTAPRALLERVVDSLATIIVGKDHQLRLALDSMLA